MKERVPLFLKSVQVSHTGNQDRLHIVSSRISLLLPLEYHQKIVIKLKYFNKLINYLFHHFLKL